VEKMVVPFLTPCLRLWLFSGLNLASWQKVDLSTLLSTPHQSKSKAYKTTINLRSLVCAVASDFMIL